MTLSDNRPISISIYIGKNDVGLLCWYREIKEKQAKGYFSKMVRAAILAKVHAKQIDLGTIVLKDVPKKAVSTKLLIKKPEIIEWVNGFRKSNDISEAIRDLLREYLTFVVPKEENATFMPYPGMLAASNNVVIKKPTPQTDQVKVMVKSYEERASVNTAVGQESSKQDIKHRARSMKSSQDYGEGASRSSSNTPIVSTDEDISEIDPQADSSSIVQWGEVAHNNQSTNELEEKKQKTANALLDLDVIEGAEG